MQGKSKAIKLAWGAWEEGMLATVLLLETRTRELDLSLGGSKSIQMAKLNKAPE
jgi:hypothetical protein